MARRSKKQKYLWGQKSIGKDHKDLYLNKVLVGSFWKGTDGQWYYALDGTYANMHRGGPWKEQPMEGPYPTAPGAAKALQDEVKRMKGIREDDHADALGELLEGLREDAGLTETTGESPEGQAQVLFSKLGKLNFYGQGAGGKPALVGGLEALEVGFGPDGEAEAKAAHAAVERILKAEGFEKHSGRRGDAWVDASSGLIAELQPPRGGRGSPWHVRVGVTAPSSRLYKMVAKRYGV